MSAKRKYSDSPDVFCYVCGEVTLSKDLLKITEKVKKSYFWYFGVKIADQDKPWLPHVICKAFQGKFMLENNVSSLFQRLRGSICFLFLYKHNFFFFEAKYVFGPKIIKKKQNKKKLK